MPHQAPGHSRRTGCRHDHPDHSQEAPQDYAHRDPWLPTELEGTYNYFDLSPYILLGANKMRANKKFREEISKVADYIVRVKKMIELDPNHCGQCLTDIIRGVPEWGAAAVQKFPLH